MVATCAEPVYLVNDLNIRLDRADVVNALSPMGSTIASQCIHTSLAGCSMSLLQDKTWLPRMSRLTTLGCQTTVYCSGLPLLLATGRLSKRHSLDINGFQSAQLSALSTEWLARPRHVGIIWHWAARHPRLRHPSTYSHMPPTRGDSYIKNRRLQSVLNAAAKAKLIYRSSRHEHDIRILLQDLHWLWSREHIDFKLAVLVYRWLHVIAHPYLCLITSNVSPARITYDFVHHHHHRYWFVCSLHHVKCTTMMLNVR